jgi:hypothetical protein
MQTYDDANASEALQQTTRPRGVCYLAVNRVRRPSGGLTPAEHRTRNCLLPEACPSSKLSGCQRGPTSIRPVTTTGSTGLLRP